MSAIKIRHTLAAIPALIFWAVSLIFFVMGLSMQDQTGYLRNIAIGLAVANTIIQFIGWDSEPDELGSMLYVAWIASYILGVGTNMVSLLNILQINNSFLEYVVAGSLSVIIEMTPERLFVLAWRSVSPKPVVTQQYQSKKHRHQQQEQQTKTHQVRGATPPGMSRAEYLRMLQQQAQEINNAATRQDDNEEHYVN